MKSRVTDENTYLELFNERNSEAFGFFYEKLYNDIYYYTAKLYRNSGISPEDVVHDVFVSIWESKEIVFESTNKLKAYIVEP